MFRLSGAVSELELAHQHPADQSVREEWLGKLARFHGGIGSAPDHNYRGGTAMNEYKKLRRHNRWPDDMDELDAAGFLTPSKVREQLER